jgi:hypothetical protein
VKNPDKLLLATVVGAVLLILAAIVIVLVKPKPTYQSEEEPGGVAHNYLLALQKEDYERAYTYLSDTLPGYPATLSHFTQSAESYSWYSRLGTDSSFAIDTEEIDGDKAVVLVRETLFYNRGLFESSTGISTFEMDLQIVGDQWKIVDSDRYFVWCWGNESGCRY